MILNTMGKFDLRFDTVEKPREIRQLRDFYWRSDPDTARAGLVTGWGADFVASVCGSGSSAGLEFLNVHWGGYLGLQSTSNGSAFYLNRPTPWCFKVSEV